MRSRVHENKGSLAVRGATPLPSRDWRLLSLQSWFVLVLSLFVVSWVGPQVGVVHRETPKWRSLFIREDSWEGVKAGGLGRE